ACVDCQSDDATSALVDIRRAEVVESPASARHPASGCRQRPPFKEIERRRVTLVQALRCAKTKARAATPGQPRDLVARENIGLFPGMNSIKRLFENQLAQRGLRVLEEVNTAGPAGWEGDQIQRTAGRFGLAHHGPEVPVEEARGGNRNFEGGIARNLPRGSPVHRQSIGMADRQQPQRLHRPPNCLQMRVTRTRVWGSSLGVAMARAAQGAWAMEPPPTTSKS